jgi:hypothetical protein
MAKVGRNSSGRVAAMAKSGQIAKICNVILDEIISEPQQLLALFEAVSLASTATSDDEECWFDCSVSGYESGHQK